MKGYNIVLIFMFIWFISSPVVAIMGSSSTIRDNLIGTDVHLFFFINLIGGDATQREDSQASIVIGVNRQVSTIDFGDIDRSLIEISSIEDVIRLENKTTTSRTITLSLNPESSPLLGDIRNIVQFPSSVLLNSGETRQIDATLLTTILTPIGRYTGSLSVNDSSNGLTYSIPVEIIIY